MIREKEPWNRRYIQYEHGTIQFYNIEVISFNWIYGNFPLKWLVSCFMLLRQYFQIYWRNQTKLCSLQYNEAKREENTEQKHTIFITLKSKFMQRFSIHLQAIRVNIKSRDPFTNTKIIWNHLQFVKQSK